MVKAQLDARTLSGPYYLILLGEFTFELPRCTNIYTGYCGDVVPSRYSPAIGRAVSKAPLLLIERKMLKRMLLVRL